ncbi:MAG: hypothetical protein IJ999_04680, partial [Clostridia bacterium]|nr:hypothetical protein [Clostridia bacterium]
AEGYSVGVVVKESTNYLSASATATVVINKKTVDVSFENETENIIYGSKPSLTPKYDGFVKESDNKINNSNIVYKVDGNIYNANVYLDASANAYQFTVDQIKNFNDQNYVLDFSSAITAVSVAKQQVNASISAANESSYYGDTTQQVLARYQVKYSLENGNEVGTPAGINLSVYTTYIQGNNISDYDLVYFDNNESKVINDGEQVESTNYIVTVSKNTVHINQRALTVNVGNTGHTYGENESDLSAIISYEGQANLPDPKISLAILSQQARMFALRSAQPLNAGDYAISVYYTNENYKITFVGKIGNVDVNQTIEATQDGSNAISVAEYTVEPMQITVNVWNGNSAYGTLTDGDKLYEVPQLAYGQQEDVLDLSVTSLVGKDATTHDVSFSYNNPNYQIVVFNTVSKETFSIESGAEQPVVVSQHTITKQNVRISVSAENVIYGFDQTFNFKAQVNGEDYGLIDNNNLSATLQIYKLAAGSAELVDTISNVVVSSESLSYLYVPNILDGSHLLDAGDYAVSITFAEDDNYAINSDVDYMSATFIVDKRPVNVEITGEKDYDGNADFAVSTFGEPNFVGKLEKDTIGLSGYVSAAGFVKGVYEGEVSKDNLSLINNNNYSIDVVTAQLTINKAIVNVTFANPTQTGLVYGDQPSLDLDYTFVDGESHAINATYYYTVGNEQKAYNANKLLDVNEYTFTVAIEENLENYTFNVTGATATVKVSPFNVTFVPTDATSKYGDPIATMGYTCESQGMPTNDWNNDIVLTTEATKTSNVGSNYSISATGANTNYSVNVKEGSYYTITARPVTVSLSNASKTYDGKSYSTEIKTASDLVNNDTISVKITTDDSNVKTGGYVYNGTPAEQTGNFGDFVVSELSISSGNANYEITYDLSATIGKARVTIDNSEDYGSIIYNGNIYSQSLTKAIGINDEQVSFSAKTNSANVGVYSSVNTEENVLEISNVVVKDKNGTQIENGVNNYEFDWKVSAEIEKNEITYTQTASALHGTIAEYTATKQENSHEFTDLIAGHTISVTFAVNENVQKGTYNYNVKYVGEVDDESADFTSIILTIKDGDTDVTSNYDVTLSLTFIISEFRVVADPVIKVYDGNMHFVEATLANDDADKIKSIEYRVKNSNGEWGDWLNDSPKYSEAMSAAVEVGFKIVVAVDDNAENDIEIISSTTIKINPRPVTVSFSNESNPEIYDGNVF